MSNDQTRRRFLAGCGTVGAAALAGCSGLTPFVGKRIERTETIAPNGAESLAVRGGAGDVAVEVGDRDDVRVDVVKEASAVTADLSKLRLRTERSDGRLRIATEWTGDGSTFGGRPSMDLDITVPAALRVERVEASVGDVRVRNTAGDLAAASETGDVDVEGIAGAASASASTGDVRVRDVEGIGDVSTSTGDCAVDVPAIDGDTTVESSTGDVDAAVGADVDAELVATTNTGDVNVADVSLDDATHREDRVSGTLGDGGPTLLIETETGDVNVTSL